MLFAIGVGEVDAFLPEMLLHGRVHGQFFTDGVAGQRPGELVPPFGLLGERGGGFYFGGVDVEVFVVGADG